MIDIEFNNKLGSSLKIYAAEYPIIPASIEMFNEIQIPGKSGILLEKTGTFESTEIEVLFNYIGQEQNWNKRWREAKAWLLVTDSELTIGDDQQFFYKIDKVEIDANERLTRRIGRFKAKFFTKDGLTYLKSGKAQIDHKAIHDNPGIMSFPIYKITGEGVCNITVNGKTVKANVGQNLTIDTERMLAYREDGSINNISITGQYSDLYLPAGKLQITITPGFTCKVIPNWRCR